MEVKKFSDDQITYKALDKMIVENLLTHREITTFLHFLMILFLLALTVSIFKDLMFVISCDIFYVILILPLNIIFGWNYGYIGNLKPTATTIIDALGAWPQRLFWMLAIVFLFQFIMYLPWKLFRGKNNEIG
jgi:uncharacterized membrane protein YwaF